MLPEFAKLSVKANENQTQSTNICEVTHKGSYYDKQSGSHGRVTTKEAVSTGDYINRGRVGYKDEYKASSTVRFGDDKGHIEYHKQEKVTRVDYSGGNTNNYGGTRLFIDDAGAYGGYVDNSDYSGDDHDAGIQYDLAIECSCDGNDAVIDDDVYSKADDSVCVGDGVIDHDVSIHAENDGFDHNDFRDDGAGYDDFYDGGGYDDFCDGGGYDDYYYCDGD